MKKRVASVGHLEAFQKRPKCKRGFEKQKHAVCHLPALALFCWSHILLRDFPFLDHSIPLQIQQLWINVKFWIRSYNRFRIDSNKSSSSSLLPSPTYSNWGESEPESHFRSSSLFTFNLPTFSGWIKISFPQLSPLLVHFSPLRSVLCCWCKTKKNDLNLDRSLASKLA